MNVLVTVPFKEEHMERIRAAAGEGATVTQLLVKPNSPDQSALREAAVAHDARSSLEMDSDDLGWH